MWASDRRRGVLLRFKKTIWRALIAELGARGRGDREAGAFLLGARDGAKKAVTRVVYLDDLDPNCLQGCIRFDGRAYSQLWDICDQEGLKVIGDVHTHGGDGVRQSGIDADNPMVAQVGHVALIVPYLGTRAICPAEVGVHLYRGQDGWTTWTGSEAAKRLHVNRWR